MIFRQLFSKKKFLEKIIISKIIKNFADLGKIHQLAPKLGTCEFT
jgi:hypothetical protein